MKKLSVLFSLILFGCGKSSDIPEVTIDNQIWMAKNLDVSTFRNGESIPEAKEQADWISAGEQGKPAFCYYKDPINDKKYGKLYNWYAVNDSRGLAPNGWHIPSDEEWTTLTNYLGGEDVAGTKMKNSSGWMANNGNNSSGFSGLPGGYRNYQDVGNGSGDTFDHIDRNGYWWSSSMVETNYAWNRLLYSNWHGVGGRDSDDHHGYHKGCGFSVRCIKDENPEKKSIKVGSVKKGEFEGNWVADANSQVRYDGNRITDITITKNGANYLFVFNKNDLGLKTMGTIDQSSNISLYGGEWLVALDATDSDNLFLKGQIFHRVK